MSRRRKKLADLVRAGTFEARRSAHRDLLENDAPPLDEVLRGLQDEYRKAHGADAKREIALQFEEIVRERPAQSLKGELEALVADLGPRGSAERIIGLFPRFFRLENGDPWVLDEWQRDFLQEAHKTVDGKRVYRVILLGVPRGNAKTPLATAHGLESLLPPWGDHLPRVFQVAGSAEQARIGTDYAKTWIEGSDDDPGVLSAFLETRSSSVHLDGGEYRVLSSDGRLGHGRKPTVGIVDELWILKTYREVQSYVAIESALHKVPDSYLLAISTAGFDMGSLLGEMYRGALELDDVETRDCLTIARDPEHGFLMWWYGVPQDADPAEMTPEERLRVTKACNPGSWIDHEAILDGYGRPGGDDLEWRRLHWNQWTVVKGAWLPTGVWNGLADPDLAIPDGAPVYVGVDAAHSFDTTAVAWCWMDAEGRLVLRSRVWSCRRDAPADVYSIGGTLDNEALVEPFIRQLGDKYDIREVMYDPRYFHTEANHLEDRFVVAEVTPSSREMRTMVSDFYKFATGGRLAHLGRGVESGRVLAAHVDATAGQKTPDGWKIDKLWPPAHPIDATVASIIASSRCALAAGGDGFFIY